MDAQLWDFDEEAAAEELAEFERAEESARATLEAREARANAKGERHELR